MKRSLVALLSLPLVFNALADTYIYDGLEYEYDPAAHTATVNGSYIENRQYIRYQKESFTPERSVVIDGVTYAVTQVGNFNSSPNLKSIAIPAGIELSEGSFSNCTMLKNISLPEGLTTIPDACFSHTAITDLSFLPSTITTIGVPAVPFSRPIAYGAFCNCEQLTDATLPNSVKYLGARSFDSCTDLSHANFNQGLISIGGDCFYGCKGLTGISIPSSVTIIDYHAFSGCSSLSAVSLRNSAVTFIGVQAFNGTAITSIDLPPHLEAIRTRLLTNTPVNALSIPAGVMRVMPYALYSMKSLKTLIIEDSGITLDFDYSANNLYGRDPFIDDTQDTDGVGHWLYGTKNIETLYLGRNTATWINPEYEFPEQSRADDASTNPFESMESLKHITIGAEVTDASQLVFSLYRNLEQITLLAETPPVLNPLSANQAASVRVTVPAGCADVYRNVNGWSGVVTIEESASISDIMPDTAARPEPVYNLMGIRMDATELPAGIYIKGNRKFIVK